MGKQRVVARELGIVEQTLGIVEQTLGNWAMPGGIATRPVTGR